MKLQILYSIFYYSAKNDKNFTDLTKLIIEIFCKQKKV